jgi:hypothetical protein
MKYAFVFNKGSFGSCFGSNVWVKNDGAVSTSPFLQCAAGESGIVDMKMFLSLKQSELITADLTIGKNPVISFAGGYTYDVMDGFKT